MHKNYREWVRTALCGASVAGIAIVGVGCNSTAAKYKILEPRAGVPAAYVGHRTHFASTTRQRQMQKPQTMGKLPIVGPIGVDKPIILKPLKPIKSSALPRVPKTPLLTYKVKKGDTLGHIAQAYKVGVGELASQNGMNKNDVLVVGRVLKIPRGGRRPSGGVVALKPRTTKYYTVEKGDYLGKIALKTKTRVSDLKKWNKLPNDKIFVGQKLALGPGGNVKSRSQLKITKRPIPANGKHKVAPGQSLSTIAYRYGLTTRELKSLNGLTTDHIVPGQTLYLRSSARNGSVSSAERKITGNSGKLDGNKYTVQSGDSLWKIAKKFKVSSKKIMEINGLKDHFLMPGKTLVIPGYDDTKVNPNPPADDSSKVASRRATTGIIETTPKPAAVKPAAPATAVAKWDPSKYTMLPHFVDQGGDTIKGIAEMYGSKKEWILAANPGVSTDKDLRTRKEIRVPVEELNIGKTTP